MKSFGAEINAGGESFLLSLRLALPRVRLIDLLPMLFFHLSCAYILSPRSSSPRSPSAITDALSSRPLGTELAVDIEDFDKYEIAAGGGRGGDGPVITFALKEFKVSGWVWSAGRSEKRSGKGRSGEGGERKGVTEGRS